MSVLMGLVRKLEKKMVHRRVRQPRLFINVDNVKTYEIDGKRYLVRRLIHVSDNVVVFEDPASNIVEVPRKKSSVLSESSSSGVSLQQFNSPL